MSNVTLLAMTRQRDRMAQYWYRCHGQRIPLQEYVSAGNLGIAEALVQFDATRHPSQALHVRQHMRHRMQMVRREEAKLGHKIPLLLHPMLAHRGYLRCLLTQVCRHLCRTGTTAQVQLFDLWVLGYSFAEMQAMTGVSISALASVVWRVRQVAQQYLHDKETLCRQSSPL